MSILINKDTKVIVQGITGRDGSFHAAKMKEYGTQVVGGTSPGKGGQEVDGIPVFNTVKDAVAATGANTSIIFVPAPFAKDAMLEAIDGGIRLVVCITEGVPVMDAVEAQRYARIKGVQVIGPNCPGLISPGESMVGIMPANIFKKGHTGVISRSGTLTYEVVYDLVQGGLGISTAVGVGGDPVVGRHQAGGGVHLRPSGAPGQADGSCRCHHLRRFRFGRGQNQGVGVRRRAGGQRNPRIARVVERKIESNQEVT